MYKMTRTLDQKRISAVHKAV